MSDGNNDQGNPQCDGSAFPGRVLDVDFPAVGAQYGFHDRKAHAGPFFLGGKEGVEEPVHAVNGYALAGVLELDIIAG